MEANRLSLKTYDAGTVSIEWNTIDSLHILTSLRILLKSGEVLYGIMLPCSQHRQSEIWHREGDPRLVAFSEVVALKPIRERFKDRVDGLVSAGMSYVKANELLRVNFKGQISYTSNANTFKLSYDAQFSDDAQGLAERQNADISFKRIMPKNWFIESQFFMESNSELGLDLRSNLAAGPGRSIVRNNTLHLFWMAGLLANRENAGTIDQYNLETIGVLDFSIFIYDEPKVSFSLSGSAMPSLSDFGRVRFNTESTLSWEVFSDFYLSWDFYYSFDNKPLQGNEAKNDWSITTLGLEFDF